MDPERELYDRAATRDGVFTLSDARLAGLSERIIKARRVRLWNRMYEGVFLAPGVPGTPRGLIRGACLAGAPHAAASHRSGAAFYEVPGGDSTLAELTCPRWLRSNRPNMIVHETNRIDPHDVRHIDGIPVMRPERVLIELASIYRSPDFIEKVLHAMLRKRLVSYRSTREVFLRLARRGRPGIRIVRVVLDRWEPELAVPESPRETDLIQILRDAALGRVVPQLEIHDENGIFIARTDAALPDVRVVVEYESDAEHTDEMSLARDNHRRNRLLAAGWLVVCARNADIKSGGDQVVAAVRRLAQHAWRRDA